jgi:eukaryotic-like serine/threonine-protein kinase
MPPAVEDDDGIAGAEAEDVRDMMRLSVRERDTPAAGRGIRQVTARHAAFCPKYDRRTARYTLVAVVFRGQTLGKYRIVEPLGSGGFGTVYLAEDTWIDKRVALKVPHRQTLDFSELLREPRLLASLNHPNIVTVITAEKQDGVFFIVMEYVPGETLETIIEQKGALDVAQALDYTCQIANAVDHAHRQGVIHRDLRPANVFVTEKGLLKVGDFGTSRFLEIAAHGTTVIGSPPYMAPEQFEGRAVFASDIYSLGITMYQMLTGELPYQTPAPSELDQLRQGGLVTPPRRRNPQIPAAIDEIVMKALRADVASRYQRPEDLLNDIIGARRTVTRPGAPAAQEAVARPAPAAGQSAPDTPAVRRPSPARIRTREIAATRFCWNCRKPLPARGRCPFCGENQ